MLSRLAQQKNSLTGCSKRPFSKAAASEGPRRYRPHFVWAVLPYKDLGERKSPFGVSDRRGVPPQR